jgi:S1-C subfamily serine protease
MAVFADAMERQGISSAAMEWIARLVGARGHLMKRSVGHLLSSTIILAAMAACSGATNNRGAPTIATPSQISDIAIDAGKIDALRSPVSITMKPLGRVSYKQIERSPAAPDFQFVSGGTTWFERKPDGLLARHLTLESIRVENRKTRQLGVAPLNVDVVYEFKPDGTIWLIKNVGATFPTANPTKGLNDQTWSAIRNHLTETFDLTNPGSAIKCAYDVAGLTGQNLTTGSAIGPQTRAQFLDRFLDCTFAAVRGGAPIYDEDARAELMTASPGRIAEIKKEAAVGLADWFNAIVDARSTVQIKGSVIDEGREFLFASGEVSMSMVAEGKSFSFVTRQELLIDPYSGLTYKAKTFVETNADDDPALSEFRGISGSEYTYLADIPQQVPEVVSVAQPAPVLATSTSEGSLADLYSRSIGAIFMVAAPEADRVSMGTGFSISPSDVLTAAHVVGKQPNVLLVGSNGQKLVANVVAIDTKRDVALLRAQGAPFSSTLKLANDLPITGSQVAVIGCPVDPSLCGTLTTGVVSFSVRPIDGIPHVQVDAVINQGNSGGPILNLRGEVIGVAVLKLSSDTIDGLGFGLSSTEVINFMREHQLVAALPMESQ